MKEKKYLNRKRERESKQAAQEGKGKRGCVKSVGEATDRTKLPLSSLLYTEVKSFRLHWSLYPYNDRGSFYSLRCCFEENVKGFECMLPK